MFDKSLIESSRSTGSAGNWRGTAISVVVHGALLAGIIAAGAWAHKNPPPEKGRIDAFVVASSAPSPPPPPPPAPSSSAQNITPRTTPQQRREFVAPTDVPQQVPQPEATSGANDDPVEGGVPGGVEGGVQGGVLGGVIGGTPGGEIGGTVAPEMPMRVAGDVQAPVLVRRVEPSYPEIARRSRTRGVVVIEAIIDREGNVTDARILRGLPMGLDHEALEAVHQWKFKPALLNGRPVPVVFTLTVNFQLD